jgi:hypothetical protein
MSTKNRLSTKKQTAAWPKEWLEADKETAAKARAQVAPFVSEEDRARAKKNISLIMPYELYDKLRAAIKEDGVEISITGAINYCVEQYLKLRKPK